MQGRGRDITSPARLRAHPSVLARPRPQRPGLPRRRVERNLYWVTDAVYRSAFLDDDEGVSGGFMTTTSRTAAQRAPGAARRGTHPGIALAVIAGGLLLLGGRAGDILGRRRVFITGILLFSLASLLGGLATSSAWLLAARALQGVGGAIASPTALALITTNFAEGRERNRALGVFAAVSVSGAAIGLLAGGILTEWLSWRWVLFVNVPIGILLALVAPLYITESERQPGRFDLGGAFTSTAGMVALVYGFIRAAQEGWSDTLTIGAFAAAVVLLAAFISIETRTRQPITPLHMFRNRNRAGSYAIMFALAAALFGMFFFLTLFVQNVLGYSPLRAGLAFLPVTAALIVTSQIAAQTLPRLGPRRLMGTGAVLAAGGLAWLSQVTATSGYV